jgi:CRISPR type I-F-associated protein Csy3
MEDTTTRSAKKGNPPKDHKQQLDLPEVFSFRRSVEISDGSMVSVDDAGTEYPIYVREHGMRTTAAYDTERAQRVRGRDATDSGNLTLVEKAKIPSEGSILKIDFTARILPIQARADMSSDPAFFADIEKAIKNQIDDKKDASPLSLISKFYAFNLLNASWGWRNRDVASSIKVNITWGNSKSITIGDAHEWPLHPVKRNAVIEANDIKQPYQDKNDYINELASDIDSAFRGGHPGVLTIHCTGLFTLFSGAEVWPSQVFNPLDVMRGKSKLGKQFFRIPTFSQRADSVGITAEKIGNALRSYDAWHANELGIDDVIAVDPKGGTVRYRLAMRSDGHKDSIHSLLPKFKSGASTLSLPESIFVMGCIVRGVVMGTKDERKSNTKDQQKEEAAAALEIEAKSKAGRTVSLFEAEG